MTPRRDWGLEAVVAYVAERADDGGVLASVAAIAAATGLSDRAVQRAIDRAVDAHQLAVEHRGANKVNRYRLVNGARNAPVPTLLRGVVTPPSNGRRGVSSRHPVVTPPRRDATVASRRPDLRTATRSPDKPERFVDDVVSLWFPENGDAPTGSRPAARSRTKARANPPARERRRDPLFDAVAECWLGGDVEPGRSAGGLVGKAAAELRGYGAEPGDVRSRWDELCRRYDEPTPAALAKHWPTLGRAERRAQRQGTRGQSSVDAALARAREAQR